MVCMLLMVLWETASRFVSISREANPLWVTRMRYKRGESAIDGANMLWERQILYGPHEYTMTEANWLWTTWIRYERGESAMGRANTLWERWIGNRPREYAKRPSRPRYQRYSVLKEILMVTFSSWCIGLLTNWMRSCAQKVPLVKKWYAQERC